MLKAELIRPRLQMRDGQVWPRRLPADYRYLAMAAELINLFQQYVGHSRGAFTEALRDYEGYSLDYPIIRGLAAVLEARSTFGNDPALKPSEVRTALFGRGPITARRDLFSLTTRQQVMAEAAVTFSVTPEQVEASLFADLAEEQLLIDPGEPLAPADLIARYNLEVARGLLYWASEVRLTLRDTYKDVFKYIKLFKLMYTIHSLPSGRGYHVTLHGPISPFVHSTIRYGLQFAKFMPALLLADQWEMEADVHPPNAPGAGPLRYSLNDQTDLRTHFKGSGPFDSRLEADFAAEFEEKYSGPKRKWELSREDELILVGDTVMIPDFSLTHHKDGRRALLEIVGFWQPHYLQRKLRKVREANRQDLILLVYESANVAKGTFEAVSAGEVLTFARKPVLKEVLAAVERCARQA